MIADELRRQADMFVELQDLEPLIAREARWRHERARAVREPMDDEYESYDDDGDDDGDEDETAEDIAHTA